MKKPVNIIVCSQLLIDESIDIHRRKGNGTLRRQIWINENKQVTRYSLTYINYHIFQGDNGRVLGYDNAHGYHHKHFKGKVEPVVFTNFETIEELFQKEFEALQNEQRKN